MWLGYLPLLALVAIALWSLPADKPASFLTRDPASIASQPVNFGLLSNIGVLFWCVAATVCLFSYWALWQLARRRPPLLLLSAGLFTTLLLLDDLFLFHERLYPRFLFGETVAMLLYAAIALGIVGRFWRTIRRSEFIFLILALGFLGLSVIVDLAFEDDPYLLEAGSKLLGIFNWAIYWTRLGLQQLRSRV